MTGTTTAPRTSTDLSTRAPVTYLRLRAGAVVEDAPDGEPMLSEGHVRMRLPGARAALELVARGCSEDELLATAETMQDAVRLQALRERLETAGWVDRELRSATGTPLVTLRPHGHVLPAHAAPIQVDTPLVASRCAYVRIDEGEVVLETSRAALQVVLHDGRLTSLLSAFASVATPDSVDAPLGITDTELLAIVQLLADARCLVAPDAEATRGAQQWAFADRLLHARSRSGSNLGAYGGTYPFADRFEPLPAVKELSGDHVTVALARPQDAAAFGPSFGEVLETRRSVRVHDADNPLTLDQLGEFLWRCARQRGTRSDGRQEVSDRPYPSGGALHELELYTVVHDVSGLEPGLYRYDPAGHLLERLSEADQRTQLLVEYGRHTAGMAAPPQVMIVLTARIGRATWKYESIAYALTLKHVGIAMQTMYLVATAMGLAPCALGGGNSDAFAAASGIDAEEEPAVGEFLLGSLRSEGND